MNMRCMQGTVRLTRFCMECDTSIDRSLSLSKLYIDMSVSNGPHYKHTHMQMPGILLKFRPVDDDMNYKQSGLSWHKPIWKKLQRKMCQKEVFIPRSPQGQAV